ncbi:ABC transporter periplasmic protein [Halomonas sp. NYA30]
MRGAGIAVAFVLAGSSLLVSPDARAHPHGWIDVSVRIITDDQGMVSGLHQTWRMDPFYSLVVFEELQQVENASLEQGLDQLGKEIRDNLSGQHYLTEVRINDEPQALGEVSEYTALERDGRLTFMFILPLETPQPLADSLLRYQVFDPTYYIEVVHEEEGGQPRDDALILNGELACELSILPADPDPEVVMEAALLDKDESGEPGLGRYFAETGQVDCR